MVTGDQLCRFSSVAYPFCPAVRNICRPRPGRSTTIGRLERPLPEICDAEAAGRPVRRPPEGNEPIHLDAYSDTSLLAGDGDELGDGDRGTDDSSLSGNEREDKTPDLEYDNNRRWKSSEWLQPEESGGESGGGMHYVPIDLDELAEFKLQDSENTQADLQMRAGQLSSDHPALAKKRRYKHD